MVEKDAVSRDFKKQVLGYGLTTAEIVYRRPDRHWLLPAHTSLTTFLDGPVMSDTAQTGENFQLQNCSMGQSKRPTCPESGGLSGHTAEDRQSAKRDESEVSRRRLVSGPMLAAASVGRRT